jgi:hypothetical protein
LRHSNYTSVALAEWLKLTFPEHRSGHSINLSATAKAPQKVIPPLFEILRMLLV